MSLAPYVLKGKIRRAVGQFGRMQPSMQTVAAAGATQGNAGVITGSAGVIIVTVTASTQGVKLPTAATGLEYRVHVPGSVGVKVYPFAADKIDAAATNAAMALAAGKSAIFFARDTLRWVTLKGA